MKKSIFKLFLVPILLLPLAGCKLPFFNPDTNLPSVNQPIACTEEAKLCPDGTAVGRTGPNCEFTPCPDEKTKPDDQTLLYAPIKDFKARITKKFFGTYITPKTSPIQPEKFIGYHTGVDVEYEDITEDVPVFAITDGEVKYSAWTSGYGGAMVISHQINNEAVLAVYGHLNPDSMIKKGQTVKAGQKIGVLGLGYSNQTDNERKHLHFALYRGTEINLRGYVSDQKSLEQWLDPLNIIK